MNRCQDQPQRRPQSAGPLQRQTESMWRAVAQARLGQTEALLLLDGLARRNCPKEGSSERLRRAARRNVISILGTITRLKAENSPHPSQGTRRGKSRPAAPAAIPSD